MSGAAGQSEWAELFPDCGGFSQSPINVDTSRTVHDPTLAPLEPLGYNQPGKKPFTLFNNGHTGKSYNHNVYKHLFLILQVKYEAGLVEIT